LRACIQILNSKTKEQVFKESSEAVQRLHCACDNKRWKHCSSSQITRLPNASVRARSVVWGGVMFVLDP